MTNYKTLVEIKEGDICATLDYITELSEKLVISEVKAISFGKVQFVVTGPFARIYQLVMVHRKLHVDSAALDYIIKA